MTDRYHDIAYQWVEDHYSIWFRPDEFPPWVDPVKHFNHLVAEVYELVKTRSCVDRYILAKVIIYQGAMIAQTDCGEQFYEQFIEDIQEDLKVPTEPEKENESFQ